MTRGDAIQVRPTNNVYTALAGVACLVVLLGIIALCVQSSAVFGSNPFVPGESAGSTR
jgi:hypothetical protein